MTSTRFAVITTLCVSALSAVLYAPAASSTTLSTSAFRTKKPTVDARSAVEALHYYYAINPTVVRELLAERGFTLSLTKNAPTLSNGQDRGYTLGIRRELNNIPGDFAPINAINRASSMLPYDDRGAIYNEAGRFIDKNLDEPGLRRVTHDAEQYCGKHYRRVGEKEAFGICAFRHITTLHLFNEDTAQCTRDITALLPGNTAAERIDREIYLCVRKKGWRNPQDAADNIDLPPVRD